MRKQFVQLDDRGTVFVRRDKVTAVEYENSMGNQRVAVTLDGGGTVKLLNMNAEDVFKKLEDSQKRYVLEDAIVHHACELWRARNEPQYDREAAVEMAERNFNAAVRRYVGSE